MALAKDYASVMSRKGEIMNQAQAKTEFILKMVEIR